MKTNPPTSTNLILGFQPSTIATLVLGGLAVAVIGVVLLFDSSTPGGRVGGDFPAFYAAGSIALDGDWEHLYDPQRQADEQAEFLGGQSGLLPFVYAPPVAAMYAPLAALPYDVAYLVHTALMVGLIVIAYRLVRPMLPPTRPTGSVIAAVAFTFTPLLGVAGGQNTAVVIFCMAAAWRLSREDRLWLAGVPLGLLMFKPQYGVPLLGLYLVRLRSRTVFTASLITLGWWAAGAYLMGIDWLGEWVRVLRDFNSADAATNAANAISWLGLSENLFGVGNSTAIAVGVALIAVTALTLIWVWGTSSTSDAIPVAAAAAGILLTSPHSMFYDAGLLTVTVAGLASAGHPRLKGPIAVGWILGLLHPVLADRIGFTPVAVAVVGGFIISIRYWRNPAITQDPQRTGEPPSTVALTVVIPAYNEVGRIEPTIEAVERWSASRTDSVECVIVDDGSSDDTAIVCAELASEKPWLRVLSLDGNQGKGAAVRAGMLDGVGAWRAFIDADGSTQPAELDKLLAADAPVAIGSVALEDSEVALPQSGVRSSAGRFGNRLIQWLVLPGIEDSQRGAKLFRADVAEEVFSACTIDRWGFDVEVLARSRALGHEPVEVGIHWEDRPVGHVRPWHYVTTLIEVLRIRLAVGRQPPVEAAAEAPTGSTRPGVHPAP